MRALAAALLAAALLRLFPPGAADRRTGPESVRAGLPVALSHGSRAGHGWTPSVQMRTRVRPSPARLGERLTWRGSVIVDPWVKVKFDRPASGGAFSWGPVRTGQAHVTRAMAGGYSTTVESLWIEAPVQIFATGPVSIPGPVIQVDASTYGPVHFVSRLPMLTVLVLPTVTASDSAATLRPVHGPLAAPWYERVPWRWVAAAVLLAAALVLALRRLLRRKPVAAPAPVVVARPPFDPVADALSALARLRAEKLPEQGRFADHAQALTRILRRYLESTLGTPRPGDTSAELLHRLRGSGLQPADLARLEGLLGLWDRVKFARAPLAAEEAGRCEFAVETLVRRRDLPREVA